MVSEKLKQEAKDLLREIETDAYNKAKKSFDAEIVKLNEEHANEIARERQTSYENGYKVGEAEGYEKGAAQSGTQYIYPAITMSDATEFINDEAKMVTSLTFSRIFKTTSWGTIMLPIALNYSDWSSKFEIAEISGIDLSSGKIGTKKNVLKSGSQTLPNHPYLIRAKLTSTKAQLITKKDCMVFPAVEGSIEFTHEGKKYVFKGSYKTMDAKVLSGKYYSSGGYFVDAVSVLKPTRVYLEIK